MTLANLQLQSQDPLWAYSDQQISFNEDVGYNPFAITVDLPEPTILPGPNEPQSDFFYYRSEVPIMHQNAQYDASGKLLLFVQDGFIYNKDGYVIVPPLNSYEIVDLGNGFQDIITIANEDVLDGISPDENLFDPDLVIQDINCPEVIISPVPGKCDKYYIIYSHGDDNSNHPRGFYYLVVDLSGDNLYFDDPSILGKVITAFNESTEYPDFNIAFETDISGLLQSIEYQNADSPWCFMELLDSTDNGDKKLFAINSYRLFQFNIESDQIYLEATFEVDLCFGAAQRNPELLGSFDIQGGDLQIAFCENLNKYVMGFYHDEPYGADKNTYIHISTIDLNGDYEGEIYCDFADFYNDFFGLAFSEDGNIMYLNALDRIQPQDESRLSAIIINSNGTTFGPNLLPSLNQVDFFNDGYHLSRIEGNYYNGEYALFFSGNSNIGVLTNTNNPANLTHLDVVPGTSSLDLTTYQTYQANYGPADNTPYYFRTFPKQNYNGTQIQDYLAQVPCCETLLEICGVHDETITGTAYWTATNNPFDNSGDPIRVDGEIVFESGSDISISGMTFEFGPNARFVVEAGGKLTVSNNSLLTNACDAMWKGVQVEGTNSADQNPQWGGDQGYFYLVGSTIENANIGVEVFAGGIVKTYASAKLRNNRVGVSMQAYSFGSLNNKSSFRLTEFITDDELLSGQDPKWLLHLNNVVGIDIKDCDFKNTAPTSVYSINHRGIGIAALNSSFNLVNTSSFGDNEIYKLTSGVEAIYTNNLTFSIEDMKFDRNRTGLFVSGNSFAEITFNHFVVPDNVIIPGDNNRTPEGCYMLNSTKYTIEENDFDHLGINRKGTFGLIVDNSLGVENEVFRNWYYDFEVGVYITNINADINNEDGLQVRCAYFENNISDFYLDSEATWREEQGEITLDPGKLSNNHFSEISSPCTNSQRDMNIHDEYGWGAYEPDPDFPSDPLVFDYWHLNSGETTPDCGDNYHINPQVPGAFSGIIYDFEDHCLSNYDLGGGGGSGGSGFNGGDGRSSTQMELDYAQEQGFIADANYLLDITVDDGDGINLLQAVTQINPLESSELKNLLLQKFPLSMEVMKATIRRLDPMDPWHLTQVLLANTPLEKELMYALEDTQVLSGFFMNFILNANENGIANIKHLLEMEINHRSLVCARIEKTLAHRYLHPEPLNEGDNPEADYTSFYSFIQNIDEDWAHEILGREAYFSNNTAVCISEIQAIKNEKKRDWWDKKMLIENNIESVTQLQIDELWADYLEEDIVYGEVLGYLHILEETDEYPLILIPEDKSLTLKKPKGDKSLGLYDLKLSVSPNPTSDEVFLSYPPEADGHGQLEIYDVRGRLLLDLELKGKGLVNFNVRTWTAGLYLVKLISDGVQMSETKFNVLK